MIPAKGKYVFSSESVTEGHPDKVADQISDAILDTLLEQDPDSHVACETLVTTGMAVIAGEITTSGYADLPHVVRETIKNIGYNSSDMGFDYQTCAVLSSIDKQSVDIAQGVNRTKPEDQGAGDQGMMFGFASNETSTLMPAPIYWAHQLSLQLARVRKNGIVDFFRPDGKTQLSFEYENGKPTHINNVVISTQHSPNVSQADIEEAVRREVIYPVLSQSGFFDEKDCEIFINRTGRFVIGGPVGDCGLTGRKIINDTYGGMGNHGGGAFSGKDPSKVDRSAAYAARHIAKNLVAAGVADEMLVQVSYAIGVARPINIFVDTYGRSHVSMSDGEIARKIDELFDLRPKAIEDRLKLRNPIYQETAAYGHMGREPQTIVKHFKSRYEGNKDVEVELFTWEKLDYVDKVKAAFGL